jgi:predicted PhzF superfamily epimerase YddE/YHI9
MKCVEIPIKEKIERAIRTLLKNDLFLLINDLDELTISHKLAEYLQQEFPDWHVDVEYNRDKEQLKRLEGELFRPDIIVHIRDTNNNLLAVEVKKSNNLETLHVDKDRLKKLTSSKGKYEYKYGLLVIFYVGDKYQKTPCLEYYQKGDQV